MSRKISVCLLVLGALLVDTLPAGAQLCPDAQEVQCGSVFSDNTWNGNRTFDQYSCISCCATGPERFHRLSLAEDSRVTVTVHPNQLDAILALLPGEDGDCRPMDCIQGADQFGSGYPETLSADLPAGTYFIAVDGYGGSYGPYTLQVECGSGQSCGANAQAACGVGGHGDTSLFQNEFDSWCGDDSRTWTGPEYLFDFTVAQATAVDFRIDSLSAGDLDLFVLERADGEGTCDPGQCLERSTSQTGSERVVFFAEEGRDYLVAVDGWGQARGGFSYQVDCLADEACLSAGELACTGELTGSTLEQPNRVSAYREVPGRMLGPESAHLFSAGRDMQVAVTAYIQAPAGEPPDLALIVVAADPDGRCAPGNTVAYSNLYQGVDESGQVQNQPESLFFQARAGQDYFVILDSADDQEAGGFTLGADCQVDCPEGQLYCDGQCVDVTGDLQHCGDCNSPCHLENARVACLEGECRMTACHPGFADCNAVEEDGCETPLGTATDCSACGDACSLENAEAQCREGECRLASCLDNFEDCNGDPADGCETDLRDPENCGACGRPCEPPRVCHQGECLLDCPEPLTDCAGSCRDTRSDPDHCGACQRACLLSNARAECREGQCRVAQCLEGYGDCNRDDPDGCEADLNADPWNCGGCGRECPPAESCQDGTCAGDCPDGLCGESCPDEDGDGFTSRACGGSDCDDQNARVFPGAQEICDGRDSNCDGRADEEGVCRPGGCQSAPPGDPTAWLFDLLALLAAAGFFLFCREP